MHSLYLHTRQRPLLWRTYSSSFPSCTLTSRPWSTNSPGLLRNCSKSGPSALNRVCVPWKRLHYRPWSHCRRRRRPTWQVIFFPAFLLSVVYCLWRCARSRVTALIEYGAQGQYMAVCPRQDVLSLVPDSPQWFEWLASLTSFRFLGQAGRFSACRAFEKGQYTRRWAARRFFHGHDFWHYLGVTDHVTLAALEQAATALQARVDAL